MATIGIVIRPGVDAARDKGLELIGWAKTNGHDVLCEEESAKILKEKRGVSPRELLEECDPVVALGGDGTLIGVARYVEKKSPVLLGVNFGRLGFLTEIAPTELLSCMDAVLAGKAKIGERAILECKVERKGKTVFTSQAVNDAVVHKGVLDRLMDLDILVDRENVLRLRADGVIISTPTGSTAYALASGGPIVDTSLSALLVTPICPHLLTVRPFLTSMDAHVQVDIPKFEGSCFLSVDGQVGFELEVGDVVNLKRSNNKVKFVRSPTKSYFEILRKKFSWGIGGNGD